MRAPASPLQYPCTPWFEWNSYRRWAVDIEIKTRSTITSQCERSTNRETRNQDCEKVHNKTRLLPARVEEKKQKSAWKIHSFMIRFLRKIRRYRGRTRGQLLLGAFCRRYFLEYCRTEPPLDVLRIFGILSSRSRVGVFFSFSNGAGRRVVFSGGNENVDARGVIRLLFVLTSIEK